LPTKTCRNKLLVGILANEWQPVIRLDHLAHPAMLNRGHGHESVEALCQLLEDLLGVTLLPGLHVCATKDYIIMILVGIHPQRECVGG
jgi:hypothetical protein